VHATRRAGFYSLFSLAAPRGQSISFHAQVERFSAIAAQRADIRRGVIALLERENAHPREQVDEDSYNGDLIGAVAAFKDPTALNALMGSIKTGNMATMGLASLGNVAVPRVLAAARDAGTRFSALVTLSQMVMLSPPPELSDQNRQKIRSLFLRSLSDSSRFVREEAADGLVAFPDREVRSAVAHVASTDPFVVKDQGRLRYPVREIAARTLRKLDLQTIKPKPSL
jgi:hypothetical protein